ncbi:isochorismatase family protein [Streptomyces cinnamoneus]|uniref:isochorismatase family protein n=1 Tax=Streptomyces cinnamoneus TaxID=53446 RepID=UPI0037952664
MTDLTLDPGSALVLIDLQQGILNLPTITPTSQILANGARLARAFRAKNLPVVLVKVAWAPDGGDLPPGRTAQPARTTAPPPAFSELPTELDVSDSDIILTKRHWGAFTGTELDLQLRRRNITQIVLAGIATSIGVESTARAAWEHSYHLTFAEDATTDTDADAHTHTFTKIFPRLGQTATTDQIIQRLGT